MQLSNIITALALAMTATALPAAENVNLLAERTNNPQPTCQNGNQQPVCCNGLLGLLGCAVNVLGGTCSGSSYCCSTTAAPVSVVPGGTWCQSVEANRVYLRAPSSISSCSTASTCKRRAGQGDSLGEAVVGGLLSILFWPGTFCLANGYFGGVESGRKFGVLVLAGLGWFLFDGWMILVLLAQARAFEPLRK